MRELVLTMEADTAEASGTELAELVRLAKSGDSAAFEQIVIQHEHRVFLTALRLLGRAEDAQDAAQEVFLRLHKYLRRFDDARGFLPWLYQVTVNVCRDIGRKSAREEHAELVDRGYSVDPAAEIDREDRRRMVAEALKTLPEKERAAVVLRDIEGLPTKEVARILGSSETTVRSQISTARLKIRGYVLRLGRRFS